MVSAASASLVLDGISFGLSIALVAVGLSLVFGIMDIVNFAHGEFYTLGAFGILLFMPFVGNYWLAVLLSGLLVAIIAIVIERLTIRPVLDRGPIPTLIITFGWVLVLQRVVHEIAGGSPRYIPQPVEGSIALGPITYSRMRLLMMVASFVVLGLTWLFITRTRWGILIRATAQNTESARRLGVHTDRLYSFTFAFSAFLAVIAASLIVPLRSAYPTMGESVILIAFIVVILGGLGSIWGVVLAAIAIGLAQSLGILFMPSFMTEVFAFAILIPILLLRPQGLFGRAET